MSRRDQTRPASSDTLRPNAPSHSEDPALAAALHEVSNALTVLLGWANAAREMKDADEIAAALAIVASRASHARTIARRAIGAEVPTPAPCSLTSVLHDATLGLAVEAKAASVALHSEVAPELVSTQIPQSATLQQVLTNLLLNAIQFSPKGAVVKLTAFAEPQNPGRIVVAVHDQGPGIAPAIRAQLFESRVTSRRGGAGIGLRHSAELSAEMGGELRLAEAGQGTRFELCWPVISEEPQDLAPRTSAPPLRRGGLKEGARILVIEDDDAVVELLELALEARGASIVRVKARSELAGALSTGPFDAVLIDLSPLHGDVEGAIADVRKSNPDARLVVMSGSVPSADVGGASIWVRKPFEIREIVEALS